MEAAREAAEKAADGSGGGGEAAGGAMADDGRGFRGAWGAGAADCSWGGRREGRGGGDG